MARPFKFTEANRKRIYKRILAGERVAEIADELNVNRETIYLIKREFERDDNQQENK